MDDLLCVRVSFQIKSHALYTSHYVINHHVFLLYRCTFDFNGDRLKIYWETHRIQLNSWTAKQWTSKLFVNIIKMRFFSLILSLVPSSLFKIRLSNCFLFAIVHFHFAYSPDKWLNSSSGKVKKQNRYAKSHMYWFGKFFIWMSLTCVIKCNRCEIISEFTVNFSSHMFKPFFLSFYAYISTLTHIKR